MALTIICVTGPGSTGKSSTIRKFASEHLKYKKRTGDVLGIFPMPHRRYAVGVSGSGDNLELMCRGQEFMNQYDGLKAMIVASRSEGSSTYQEIRRVAERLKADFREIETQNLASKSKRMAAIKTNVEKIKSYLPRRTTMAAS